MFWAVADEFETVGRRGGIAGLRNGFPEILNRQPVGVRDKGIAAESRLLAGIGKALDLRHLQHIQTFQLVQQRADAAVHGHINMAGQRSQELSLLQSWR